MGFVDDSGVRTNDLLDPTISSDLSGKYCLFVTIFCPVNARRCCPKYQISNTEAGIEFKTSCIPQNILEMYLLKNTVLLSSGLKIQEYPQNTTLFLKKYSIFQ